MNEEHNYGIDLLRTFLMFLIISGHLLVHTGIRENVALYSPKWVFSWSYQALALCAVNCFVLISGYFSNVNSHKFKVKKILRLYGEVWLYSVAIYLVLLIVGAVDFSVFDAIHSFFPVLSGQYWFFSSYILLLLLMPFLNVMLSRLSDCHLKLLSVIIIAVFYVIPIFSIVFMQYDPTEGMGIIGFITLFILGHTLKRFKVRLSKLKCVIGLIINCMVMLASKITLSYIINYLGISAGSGLFYHYNTIFQLVNAALLLLVFKEIQLKGRGTKVTGAVGTSVFGVYLLHEHPCIRSVIWDENLYNLLFESSSFVYIVLVLFIPVALFFMCFVLDKTRQLVGKKLAKIPFIQRIEKKITVLEDNINNKINNPF